MLGLAWGFVAGTQDLLGGRAVETTTVGVFPVPVGGAEHDMVRAPSAPCSLLIVVAVDTKRTI